MSRHPNSKLKLKKTTMAESQLPSNQEALFEDDSDFNDLDLTECNTPNQIPPIDIAFQAIKDIEILMEQRLNIAKAREGMVYGRSSKHLPPYCHVNLKCKPDLGGTEENQRFTNMIDSLIEETQNNFMTKCIDMLDTMIDEKKDKITHIRREAKDKIGTTTKAGGSARSMLYKKLGELKDDNDKKLAEFKTQIRCNQQKRPQPNKRRWNRPYENTRDRY